MIAKAGKPKVQVIPIGAPQEAAKAPHRIHEGDVSHCRTTSKRSTRRWIRRSRRCFSARRGMRFLLDTHFSLVPIDEPGISRAAGTTHQRSRKRTSFSVSRACGRLRLNEALWSRLRISIHARFAKAAPKRLRGVAYPGQHVVAVGDSAAHTQRSLRPDPDCASHGRRDHSA